MDKDEILNNLLGNSMDPIPASNPEDLKKALDKANFVAKPGTVRPRNETEELRYFKANSFYGGPLATSFNNVDEQIKSRILEERRMLDCTTGAPFLSLAQSSNWETKCNDLLTVARDLGANPAAIKKLTQESNKIDELKKTLATLGKLPSSPINAALRSTADDEIHKIKREYTDTIDSMFHGSKGSDEGKQKFTQHFLMGIFATNPVSQYDNTTEFGNTNIVATIDRNGGEKNDPSLIVLINDPMQPVVVASGDGKITVGFPGAKPLTHRLLDRERAFEHLHTLDPDFVMHYNDSGKIFEKIEEKLTKKTTVYVLCSGNPLDISGCKEEINVVVTGYGVVKKGDSNANIIVGETGKGLMIIEIPSTLVAGLKPGSIDIEKDKWSVSDQTPATVNVLGFDIVKPEFGMYDVTKEWRFKATLNDGSHIRFTEQQEIGNGLKVDTVYEPETGKKIDIRTLSGDEKANHAKASYPSHETGSAMVHHDNLTFRLRSPLGMNYTDVQLINAGQIRDSRGFALEKRLDDTHKDLLQKDAVSLAMSASTFR